MNFQSWQRGRSHDYLLARGYQVRHFVLRVSDYILVRSLVTPSSIGSLNSILVCAYAVLRRSRYMYDYSRLTCSCLHQSNSVHLTIPYIITMSTSAPNACYFSFQPTHNAVNMQHYDNSTLSNSASSTPTEDDMPTHLFPISSPSPTTPLFKLDALRLLQLQTSVAHPHTTRRPQPQPIQTMPHIDDTSDSSSDGSTSPMEPQTSQPTAARCSRCHRTLSSHMPAGNVSFGLNSWYCSRCAEIVGYNR